MSESTRIVFTNEIDENAGIYVDADDGKRYVEIGEFDMNKMHPLSEKDVEHGVKICVIGKPGTGKSRIIEQILLYKSHIAPVSQIFHATDSINHYYKDRSTDITVFTELDIKAMENFVKRQELARKYLPNPWAIQVLDDVTDDPKIMNKHPFGAFYKRGRHWTLLHCLCLHYPLDMKPGMRSCIDYVFIMANGILSERKKLYENFASGSIPTFQDFCDILDGVTEDHTALVINNMSQSSAMKDRVFYFRADISRVPKNFKIGCEDAYKFQEQRLDPNATVSL